LPAGAPVFLPAGAAVFLPAGAAFSAFLADALVFLAGVRAALAALSGFFGAPGGRLGSGGVTRAIVGPAQAPLTSASDVPAEGVAW
jgi:hypothetical protein